MRFMSACLLLAFVGISSATTYAYPRGCIYANGRCVQECPVGTVSYTIDCGFVTPEATCRESRPRPAKQQTCGYSACHCAHPTVRDETSGQCVHLDRCPGARIVRTHGGGKSSIERKPYNPKTQVPAPVVPTVPFAPRQPVAPQKPVAPTAPVLPTAPVAPVVPVYNTGNLYTNTNNGYNNGYTNTKTDYITPGIRG